MSLGERVQLELTGFLCQNNARKTKIKQPDELLKTEFLFHLNMILNYVVKIPTSCSAVKYSDQYTLDKISFLNFSFLFLASYFVANQFWTITFGLSISWLVLPKTIITQAVSSWILKITWSACMNLEISTFSSFVEQLSKLPTFIWDCVKLERVSFFVFNANSWLSGCSCQNSHGARLPPRAPEWVSKRGMTDKSFFKEV